MDGAAQSAAKTTTETILWIAMNFDQFRVPQGSLFLELFSCRSPTNTVQNPSPSAAYTSFGETPPPELYSIAANGTVTLDLARRSGDQVNPVWRVGILRNRVKPDSPDGRLTTIDEQAYDTLSFRPEEDFNRFHPPTDQTMTLDGNGKFDRVIWFTNSAPKLGDDNDGDGTDDTSELPNDTLSDRIYYNRFANPANLELGAYAVVGPRPETFIGSRSNGTGDPDPLHVNHRGSQLFSLTANSFAVTVGGNPLNGSLNAVVRPVLGLMAGADPVAGQGWSALAARNVDGADGFGICVSEPLPENYNLYDAPVVALRSTDDINANPATGYPIDTWYDYDNPPGDTLKDKPFDRRSGAPIETIANGTDLNYATAYLQRLADPLRPYNSDTNPYITVDYYQSDLTVFNGEANNSAVGNRFASRRRMDSGISLMVRDSASVRISMCHGPTRLQFRVNCRSVIIGEYHFKQVCGIAADAVARRLRQLVI
ncbi:MAG: hypothetical protein R3C05_17270 [Pirellulaceae bacterium]